MVPKLKLVGRRVVFHEEIVRRAVEEEFLKSGDESEQAFKWDADVASGWERCLPEPAERWEMHSLVVRIQRRLAVPTDAFLSLHHRETDAAGVDRLGLTNVGADLLREIRQRCVTGRARHDQTERLQFRQRWAHVFLAVRDAILVGVLDGTVASETFRSFCREADPVDGFWLMLFEDDSAPEEMLADLDRMLAEHARSETEPFRFLENGELSRMAGTLVDEARYNIVRYASRRIHEILDPPIPDAPIRRLRRVG